MSTQVEGPSPQVRLTVLAVVIVCLFGALFARLWFLQVINEPKAQAAAQDNSVRLVYTPAPRGRILDRNGKVLVDNTVSEVVTISRVTATAEPDVISRLALLLSVSNDELLQQVNDKRYSPYVPVPDGGQRQGAHRGLPPGASGASSRECRCRRWPSAPTPTAPWPPTSSATSARSAARS